MKKLTLFCLLVFAVSLSFAQQELDWKNIQTIKYPIAIVKSTQINENTIVMDTSYIRKPNDLTIYCANQSEKYISRSKNAFLIGTTSSVLGGTLVALSYASNNDSGYALMIAGGLAVLAGAICDIICINDLFQFAKWNHREKAVQFTVKPTGVALSF